MYDDGYTSTSTAFFNLHEIENTTYSIPIGSTVPRFLAIHYTPRCDGLQLGKDANSDPVEVTRVDAHTWHAVSQAYPNDRAFCNDERPDVPHAGGRDGDGHRSRDLP